MKIRIILVIAFFFILVIFNLTHQPASVQDSVLNNEDNNNRVLAVNYIIESGETFASIMKRHGVPESNIALILESAEGIYDFSRIKADQPFRLIYIDGVFSGIEYDINDQRVLIIEKVGEEFQAREEDIQYDINQVVAGAVIISSLFEDALRVGIEEETILELADIFAWDIDFATDIREGDSFKIVYEKRFREGREVGPGRILAARFKSQGIVYWAFLYEEQDKGEQYYDFEGRSLARQFLRSPLNYSYISSGFSYGRFHPILKKVLPHLAIDYAASAGTPVVSTAGGQVVYAGWKGGDGIVVEVKHNGIYSTQYGHLSGMARGIGRGIQVKQGQVIGYVGSTGFATGPHLQYSMTKNGTLVNPLNLKLPSSGEPIKPELKEDFNKAKEQFKNLLLGE